MENLLAMGAYSNNRQIVISSQTGPQFIQVTHFLKLLYLIYLAKIFILTYYAN